MSVSRFGNRLKAQEGKHRMDLFSVITLLGGLALFLYGMKVMSDGLEKSSNGKLNNHLKKVTDNRCLAVLFGAGLTIAVQSSSAVTVMLVGLVNSGILEFRQTIDVIMGSNVGKTLTSWILSLAAIDSDVIWLNLLKPENFSPLFALAGIVMIMVGKKQKIKSAGNVLIGFAVLMFGMEMMSDSMEPLADMPEFARLLTAFENPVLAVAVGAIFTGIIQSSAASVAILQALSMTGGITYGMAIPIIMGQNIGTCITAIISSIGVNRSAKKVAVAHLSFNIFGTFLCLLPFCIGNAMFRWAFTSSEITPLMIAVVHSIFNIVTTVILLPFSKQLERFANRVLPDKVQDNPSPQVLLDNRLLTMPSVAVKKSFDAVVDMCKLSRSAFLKSMDLLAEYDEKGADQVSEMEAQLDKYQDQLGTYMMKVSKIGLSEEDSKSVAKVLHTIDDFERIGDHAVNLIGTARELHEKKISFSENAAREITMLTGAIHEILNITATAFETNDLELASSVEPLNQVIGNLILEVKRNHITRLQNGVCTMETGFILNDLLTGYNRVSGHCSNIAVAIIEAQHGTFDTHGYLESVKEKENRTFSRQFQDFSQRFSLGTDH